VKQCYDVSMDDRLLRQILTLTESEKGKYFSKLRAEYRIRREFFNTVISVSNNTKNLGDILNNLGFKVKREKSS
jgi:erythronate-4-phosphate dehydrogenase